MAGFRGARLRAVWLVLAAVAGLVATADAVGQTGVVTEFPLPTANSRPVGITAGSDGNLWFTEQLGNRIGRITPAGVVTEFPLPTANSLPSGITAGPDGNLWFTQFAGNRIGRITLSGVVTEFPLPTPGSDPFGITAGADGNLWFTELNGNRIGRITPAGGVTEFPVPTADSKPRGITAGPDGNLWFTEQLATRIGRITPAGGVTEFPVPTVDSQPLGITAGPDGNIWFTEFNANRIGRITPAGAITEFPLATANAFGITAGPDGNLWFTQFNNRIVRITPAGGFTEFPLPSGSGPLGITAGSDGELWFAEVDRIGRITSGALASSVTLTVAKGGTGTGTVGSLPEGIACGTDCAETYPFGTLVSLTAAPAAGSIFAGWSESGCDGAGGCAVTLLADTTVTATFSPAPPPGSFVLTVIRSGSGAGTVTGLPGIACGGDCDQTYPSGTTVTLAAIPVVGSFFAGWSGGGCAGTDDCTVAVTDNTTVRARFDLVPADLVAVAVNQPVLGPGQTLVASLALNNPGLPLVVDFYLGVLLPDGDTLVLFTDGGAGTAFARLSDPTSLQPVAAGFTLATPLSVAVPTFFSYTRTGGEAGGRYVFFFAVTRPGAFSDGVVGPDELLAVSVVSFAFVP